MAKRTKRQIQLDDYYRNFVFDLYEEATDLVNDFELDCIDFYYHQNKDFCYIDIRVQYDSEDRKQIVMRVTEGTAFQQFLANARTHIATYDTRLVAA